MFTFAMYLYIYKISNTMKDREIQEMRNVLKSIETILMEDRKADQQMDRITKLALIAAIAMVPVLIAMVIFMFA